ncbi:MAG: S1 RNA-binding domain-containing protein [Anaerolineales bacterium]|nr:S1 RNA-binding domain-containing protein [Anaerolineales bacterium]
MIEEKAKDANSMPMMDDGWWESVLAEESYITTPNKPDIKNEAKKISVNWNQAKDLYQQDKIIQLKVTGYNRGGLLVEGEAINGFVPFSHLIELCKAEHAEINFDSYIGKTLALKIIECTPQDDRIVFSERAAQTESGKRTELFHSLCEGQVVRGTVTNLTDFGAFIDLGGAEGLIHISELSWGRVTHPSQILKIGNTIEAQVLGLSAERCRVALSLKRLKSNPWLGAEQQLTIDSIHNANISCILTYGAFAKLNELEIEGLIHISEIPQAEGKSLNEILVEGQSVQVKILNLDSKHHRLGLSMRLE